MDRPYKNHSKTWTWVLTHSNLLISSFAIHIIRFLLATNHRPDNQAIETLVKKIHWKIQREISLRTNLEYFRSTSNSIWYLKYKKYNI